MIFHLVPKAEWDVLLLQRPYIPSTYTKDGFIHCSGDEATMLGVANRFYKDVKGDVLLLVIDEAKLKAELRWEGPIHPQKQAQAQTQSDESTTSKVESEPLNARAMPPEAVAEVGTKASEPAPADPVAPTQPVVSAPEPRFPHVYGPINREAIVEIRQFVRDAQGNYTGTVPLLPATPAPALPEKPAPVVSDPLNPLNIKSPSQMADELLDATDNFSEALKRYKDRVESHIDDLDKNIKRSLGE